jgi:hypothetical protein
MCFKTRSANEGWIFQNRRFGTFFPKFSGISEFGDFGNFSENVRFSRKFFPRFSRNRLYLVVLKTGKRTFFPEFRDFSRRPETFWDFFENTNFDQFYTNFNDVYTAAQSGFIKKTKCSENFKIEIPKKFSRNPGNFPTFSKFWIFRKFSDFPKCWNFPEPNVTWM